MIEWAPKTSTRYGQVLKGQKVECFWNQYYECSHILSTQQALHPQFTEHMWHQTRLRNTDEEAASKLEFRICIQAGFHHEKDCVDVGPKFDEVQGCLEKDRQKYAQ